MLKESAGINYSIFRGCERVDVCVGIIRGQYGQVEYLILKHELSTFCTT